VPAADALAATATALAIEAAAVLGRGGGFKEAHEKYYKPAADELTSGAVQAALAAHPGSQEDLAAGLGEVLAKVGLGERLDGALKWAADKGVGSLGAMQALLQVQEKEWATLLSAVGPTKSFHRMRIQTQLKKMADGSGVKKSSLTSTELYWAKFDSGPAEATGTEDIEEEP